MTPRTLACHGLSLLAALLPPSAFAEQQREPVLRQVKVPHSYYWREMYVPQVTGGPTAAAWSPDGSDLVYAMGGSLWRQRPGSDEARELTAGPGLDHQPDWSPDGRFVVFSSYRDDAISLRVLEVASGVDRPLLEDGAVNLEPRFSPDGKRLAWVSTAFEGRWHVFVADFADGKLGRAQRLTEDVDSGLPRYYYSRYDHYLSPTWSPDGRELILVSNRGRVMGSGGFWRMEARPAAPMRALWYEETTWKARPDWSRDGRRVVYAGYHGRQWHQLWLMTADGGDPFQLTYGDFDATAPRWAPDASRIAYVSNDGGPTSLWVVEVPGGRRVKVEPKQRRYAVPMGRLAVSVRDRAGRPLPVRLSVQDAGGRSWAPDGAWRHADEMFVRGERSVEYRYFHAAGRAELPVRPGKLTVQVWRGPEWAVATREVEVGAGARVALDLVLERIDDLPARGLWGGDLHVHMNYGGAYRNTPAHLAFQARAEGLHVVENLVVNKEQRVPDVESWSPRPDPSSRPDFLFLWGQEFHTSYWGHLGVLGLSDHLLLPDYVGYANTAAASLQPTNARVTELARAQGAITGYVHPYDEPPNPADRKLPLNNALPVDVALGKSDYLEVMGFSDHRATADVWYRLLNCGFRLPAGGGTDAFPNFASLRGPAGLVRTYAQAGPKLTPEAFHQAIRAGRTFVTNGPLLDLKVDGRGPGEVIALAAARPVKVEARMRSNLPLDRLELVHGGKVVRSVPLAADGMRAEASFELPVEGSGWYVLRAQSDRPRLPVLDLYPYATTGAIHVEVGGQPLRSAPDADFFLAWIDRMEEGVRAWREWNTEAEREAVLAELEAAREEFRKRR